MKAHDLAKLLLSGENLEVVIENFGVDHEDFIARGIEIKTGHTPCKETQPKENQVCIDFFNHCPGCSCVEVYEAPIKEQKYIVLSATDCMNDTVQHIFQKVKFLDYLLEALSASMQAFRKMEPMTSKNTKDTTGHHKNGQECTGPNCYFCEDEANPEHYVDMGYDVKCEGCDHEDCSTCGPKT
jgi:hypothetical protein